MGNFLIFGISEIGLATRLDMSFSIQDSALKDDALLMAFLSLYYCLNALSAGLSLVSLLLLLACKVGECMEETEEEEVID